MGRDCKYCGAYISDIVKVCPACGKRSKPESDSGAERWTGPYTAGTAAQSQYGSEPERDRGRGNDTGEQNKAYTYKEEYERRYGSQQESGQRRRGQQAPPRGAADTAEEQAPPRYTYAQYNAPAQDEDEDVRRNRGISFLSYFGPLFLIPYFMRQDSEFARFHCNQGLLLLLANIAVNACAEVVPIIGWLISIIGSIFVLCGFISGLCNVAKGLKKPLPIIGEINLIK